MNFLRTIVMGTVGGLAITGVSAYLQRKKEVRASQERDAEVAAIVANQILIYVSRTSGGDAADPLEVRVNGDVFTSLPPLTYNRGVFRSGENLLTVRPLSAPEDGNLKASLAFHAAPQETLAFTTALVTDDQGRTTVVLTREPDIATGLKRLVDLSLVADADSQSASSH